MDGENTPNILQELGLDEQHSLYQKLKNIFFNGINAILPEVEKLQQDDKLKLYELLKHEHLSYEVTKVKARLKSEEEFASKRFSVFDTRKKENVTPKVIEIRKRRYMAFVHLYSNPFKTDDDICEFLQFCNPEISYSTALLDLTFVKKAIGDINKSNKELYRIQVIDMHKRAYQKADENGNEVGMVAAANGISKAANLEKEDPDQYPWEEIIPPEFEPVHDIEAAGFERKPGIEEKIKKLKRKYDADAVIEDE